MCQSLRRSSLLGGSPAELERFQKTHGLREAFSSTAQKGYERKGMNNDQTFLDGRGGKKDAISLGCKSGSLETSSLVVVTGRRRRLPRNLQRYKAGFRIGYEPLKEEKGIHRPSRTLCRFHTPAQRHLAA